MNKNRSPKLSLITAMSIFGTMGIFRRSIPLSSPLLAMLRGAIGTLFLLVLLRLKQQPLDRAAIRKNAPLLCLTGTCIGINWILLFESYRFTSVATATLCYYMAPILVILASPIVFKERLTPKKCLCAAVAFCGMILISGVLKSGFSGIADLKGVFLALGAAVLYATVMMLNKRLQGIGAYDRTILQLGSAAIVLSPYVLLTEDWAAVTVTPVVVLLVLILGTVHTGWTYALYFGTISRLPAQTVALFSYSDPIVAIFLSAVLLREGLTLTSAIGAVLVLGSTLVSELTKD